MSVIVIDGQHSSVKFSDGSTYEFTAFFVLIQPITRLQSGDFFEGIQVMCFVCLALDAMWVG